MRRRCEGEPLEVVWNLAVCPVGERPTILMNQRKRLQLDVYISHWINIVIIYLSRHLDISSDISSGCHPGHMGTILYLISGDWWRVFFAMVKQRLLKCCEFSTLQAYCLSARVPVGCVPLTPSSCTQIV